MVSKQDKVLVTSSNQIKRGVFLCIPWFAQPDETEIVVEVTRVFRVKAVFKVRFLSDGQVYYKEFPLDTEQLTKTEGCIYVATHRYAQAYVRKCVKKQRAALRGARIELTRAKRALLETINRSEKLSASKR